MFVNLRWGRCVLAAGALLLFPLGGCTSNNKKAASKKGGAPKSMSSAGKAEPMTGADQKLATLAVDVLAKDLKLSKDKIRVDTVRDIEWNDSSVGCPKPGQAYMQVITPGHKITLRVGKKFYFVHEAKGRAFVCKTAASKPGLPRNVQIAWGKMAFEAQRDLAKRLSVDPKVVRIAGARKKTFEDSSLGCPERGEKAEKKGQVEGYVITILHGKRPYKYHTDLKRVFVCPPISAD